MWVFIIIFVVVTTILLANWPPKGNKFKDFGGKLAEFYDAIKYYPSWFKKPKNNYQDWDTGLVNLQNLKETEIKGSWVEKFLSSGNEPNGKFLDFNFSINGESYDLVFLIGCKQSLPWEGPKEGDDLEYHFPCAIIQDKKTVVFKTHIHETDNMWTTDYSCFPDAIPNPGPWFRWLYNFMQKFLTINARITERNLKRLDQEYKEANKNKI